jgi:hypothetical protein
LIGLGSLLAFNFRNISATLLANSSGFTPGAVVANGADRIHIGLLARSSLSAASSHSFPP